MKAILKINDRDIEVEISEKELEKLTFKNKTGYERVPEGHEYCRADYDGVYNFIDDYTPHDDVVFFDGNYYTDEKLAEDCARADRLLRQLRRFAVEHRAQELSWGVNSPIKYSIYFDYVTNKIKLNCTASCQEFGQIYFDRAQVAEVAIEFFRDELTWYFTQFRDSIMRYSSREEE